MPRFASVFWDYYYTNDTKFKTDKSHKNAWCNACLERRVVVLQELDRARVGSGELEGIRDYEDLRVAAIEHISPICGKPERMKSHLKNCKSISDDDRTVALLSAQSAEAKSKSRFPSSSYQGMMRTAIMRSRRLLEMLPPEELQAEFNADLYQLFVAVEFPWSMIDEPTFREFMHTWVWADVDIPTRQDMEKAYIERELKHKASDIRR
ncbi:hypothetical protein CVT26_006071 [Gymnopilus dilepis]|uniref:Uncharacterized protein n=1 Tax=Gymnopilus dilepis TaxID=231916 RepID=A0A409VQ90_9AGAR|nr:hypothetical protein CVT26_006071 [Gymnopilus dilepis]